MTLETLSYQTARHKDHSKRTQEPPKDAPTEQSWDTFNVTKSGNSNQRKHTCFNPRVQNDTKPHQTHSLVTTDWKLINKRERTQKCAVFPSQAEPQGEQTVGRERAVLSRRPLTRK